MQCESPAFEEEIFIKVLVTGGAGFFGSDGVDVSIEAGHQDVIVDRQWKHGNCNPVSDWIAVEAFRK